MQTKKGSREEKSLKINKRVSLNVVTFNINKFSGSNKAMQMQGDRRFQKRINPHAHLLESIMRVHIHRRGNHESVLIDVLTLFLLYCDNSTK